MNIGSKIRKLREDRKISQSALALELGITQSFLQKIENNNEKKVDFLLMDKVCKYFDKDFSYFMNDNVVYNTVAENKGQISCKNFTVYNYPESIFTEIQKIIDENKVLKEKEAKLSYRT